MCLRVRNRTRRRTTIGFMPFDTFDTGDEPSNERCRFPLSVGTPCPNQAAPSDWPWPLCEAHAQEMDRAADVRATAASARLRIAEVTATRRLVDARDRNSVVYFLRRQQDGLIKIGHTRRLASRLDTLRRDHGPLVALGFLPGDHLLEHDLHRKFAAHHVGREWFRPAPSIVRTAKAATHVPDESTHGDWRRLCAAA